jgi:hypothetical protein
VSYKQELSDEKIINEAVMNSSLSFLRYLWEQSHITKDEKFLFKRSSNNENYKIRNEKNKSMLQVNFNLGNNFNNGNLVFELSYLIKQFSKVVPFNQAPIHEIISNWNFIEKDRNLLATLFEVHCFDDISTLIYRIPGRWEFTKEQFSVLIEEGELDLILYYVRIRECRVILENPENQKKIINNYIRFGNKMYYGAEMLSYISRSNWNMNSTA